VFRGVTDEANELTISNIRKREILPVPMVTRVTGE